MRHRVLVVVTAPISDSVFHEAVEPHIAADSEILVVAPASDLSRMDWLANAEDDARAIASRRAEQVAETAPTDATEARVGDTDPVQAIADALRTFPADELLIVTHADDDAGWLETGTAATAFDRFSLPITHVAVAA
jgi:hypothetical protein